MISITREHEAVQREKKRKHEEELQRWQLEYEARDKSWVGYVRARRIAKRMMGRPEPFPHLPNPIPSDYPIPDDWNQEHLG